MTEDDILAVVRKHLANAIEGLAPGDIDPTRSMKDYGANSLDIVEVVSATMRELRLKVPRAELSKLKNIQGLVQLFHQAHQQSPQRTGV